MAGNTIYCQCVYGDVSAVSGYALKIYDSVFTNFVTTSAYFSSASISIYNCAFSNSQSAVSSTFHLISASNNQYGWSSPTNYPLTRIAGSDYGYNQPLVWFINHKVIFKPFSGLTTPPEFDQYGYQNFVNYRNGLFGNSRINFNYLG
jgi:hypothetical protein